MSFSEEQRKDAIKYKAILHHYKFDNIARTFNDEAIYYLMTSINKAAEKSEYKYGCFYEAYKEAEKQKDFTELTRKYSERTKQLLEISGHDEFFIKSNLKQYTYQMILLHCWDNGLEQMFKDFNGPEHIISLYKYNLEESYKNGVEPAD